MKISIVTGCDEKLRDLRSITEPLQRAFAARIGAKYYAYTFDTNEIKHTPKSWFKIPCIIDRLLDNDMTIWMDTDIIPTEIGLHQASLQEFEQEIKKFMFDRSKEQALVCHPMSAGLTPNCGMWWIKKSFAPALSLLALKAGDMRKGFQCPWWEQSCLLKILGFSGTYMGEEIPTPKDLANKKAVVRGRANSRMRNSDHDLRLSKPSDLFDTVYWLPQHFNGVRKLPFISSGWCDFSDAEKCMFPEGRLVKTGGESSGEHPHYLYHHCGDSLKTRISVLGKMADSINIEV